MLWEAIFVSGLVSAFQLLAAQDPVPAQAKHVDWQIKAVYTPMNFDDNDTVQFVIEGKFPNACYSIGNTWSRSYPDHKTVLFGYDVIYEPGPCLQVESFFAKTVEVGTLPEGEYKIATFRNINRPLGKLRVQKARSRTKDNSPYAPVTSAIVESDDSGLRRFLTLTGYFPNTCLQIDPDATQVVATARNVLEVLPFVRMVGDVCSSTIQPYTYTLQIPESVPPGKYLIHIRTMNGNSLNNVEYVNTESSR